MKHHQHTLESLIKAMPSLTNSINILDALLREYSTKDMLNNKASFGISLSDDSLTSTVSRLRRFTK